MNARSHRKFRIELGKISIVGKASVHRGKTTVKNEAETTETIAWAAREGSEITGLQMTPHRSIGGSIGDPWGADWGWIGSRHKAFEEERRSNWSASQFGLGAVAVRNWGYI